MNQSCLHATWHVRLQDSTPLLSYQHILLSAQRTQSARLLNNCLLVENGWQQLATWLAHDCFSQLAQAGVQTIAWILPATTPPDSSTGYALHNVRGIRTETFCDVASAYQWLHK